MFKSAVLFASVDIKALANKQTKSVITTNNYYDYVVSKNVIK